MGENGSAKNHQSLGAYPPFDVSINLGQNQTLGGSKCYDDDGRPKRTGERIYPSVFFSIILLFGPGGDVLI